MTLSDRYRRLARLIDALESQGLTVRSAAPADELAPEETSGERIPIRLELELPSGTTLDQLVETTQEPTASDVDGAEPDVSHSSTRSERTTHSDAADHFEPSTPANDGGESVSVDDATDTVSVDDSDAVSTNDDSADSDAVPTNDDSDVTDTVSTNDDSDAPDDEAATDVVSCTHPECDRTFETDRGMKIHRTKAHSLSELIDGGADEAVHCDPEVLADVYEKYDTFAEMTEALDVDVGPQAVRKQMIRHDIHEPGLAPPSSETNATNADVGSGDSQEESVADGGSVVADTTDPGTDEPKMLDEQGTPDDSDAASPADHDDVTADDADPVTDDSDAASVAETGPTPAEGGEPDADSDAERDSDTDSADDAEESFEPLPDIDLPASLTLDEFRTAVEEATTLYDVQRALDLDRETTQELLREYDLLELVCGRAATVSEREKLKTEIHERLQRATT
jgi:hypothetical protein